MCFLKIYSDTYSFKKFSEDTKLSVFSVYDKGEYRDKKQTNKFDEYRLSLYVSEKEWSDFSGQTSDAISFLSNHFEELLGLLDSIKDVEACLDFPIYSRLDNKIINQNDYIPRELIVLAGKLNLEIGMSQYSKDVSEQCLPTRTKIYAFGSDAVNRAGLVTKIMDIKPGIGIGIIKFGLHESDIVSILGSPDLVEEEEYVIDSGYWYRMLAYNTLALEFFFDKEDEYRLGSIDISGFGYKFLGKDLFGKSINFVTRYLCEKTNEIPKKESDARNRMRINYDTLGLLFRFESEKLTGIECNYLFEDDGETEIWPT